MQQQPAQAQHVPQVMQQQRTAAAVDMPAAVAAVMPVAAHTSNRSPSKQAAGCTKTAEHTSSAVFALTAPFDPHPLRIGFMMHSPLVTNSDPIHLIGKHPFECSHVSAELLRVRGRPAMITHQPRTRPEPWGMRKQRTLHRALIPFVAFEWALEWVAFALSNWTLLEVLEYMGTFSVLVAVIFYFAESGDRVKQRHYQAWQVINTAQGKGGSGGRIEALQELNADKVPLVGVDVSSAFLQGLTLNKANLLRSDFSSADLRNSHLDGVDFTLANLNSANLRGASLDHARCSETDLRNSDLEGSNLAWADFTGARLDDADLRGADLKEIQWQHMKSITGANIADVKNAPAGFADWAVAHGAVTQTEADPN